MKIFSVLSVQEAWKKIDESVQPLPTERVPVDEAGGRVCAETVNAPEDLPSFDRSTVDGYAVRSRDTFGASDSSPALFTLRGEVRMGEPPPPLAEGACAYVPTGGALPAGADAVVMEEYAEPLDDLIHVLRPVRPGENVILRGEDFQKGGAVVQPGQTLRPQEIGVLAALGVPAVQVYRRPRVRILSTGNELCPPGTETLPLGMVRDSNGPMLRELCGARGALPGFGGIVPDDPKAFREALAKGLESSDFVLLSGGSSVGTRDFTAETLRELGGGALLIEGVAIQPGKPLLFSLCQGKPVMGLPGHPASALSTFLLFGARVLDRLQGRRTPEYQPTVRAKLALNVPSRPGRTDVVRVKLSRSKGANATPAPRLAGEGDAEWVATPLFGRSGLLHTLTEADGFVLVPPDQEGLAEGETVEVVLYGPGVFG